MRQGRLSLLKKYGSSCSRHYGGTTHLQYSVSHLATSSKSPFNEKSSDSIDAYLRESKAVFPPTEKLQKSSSHQTNEESIDANDGMEQSPMVDLAKWVDTTVTAIDGKVFSSPNQLISRQKAVGFPAQDCFCLLDGNPTRIPDDVESDIKVIIMSFRHYGFSLLRSWLSVFEENDDQQDPKDIRALKKSIPPVKIVELCYIEAGILSMAKNVMAKSMRSKLEHHRLSDSYIRFGGIMDIATKLGLPNIYTGYIFVLDKQNNVRWRASGEPTEQEIKTMLKCISQLSKSNV